ncbi:DUF6783 domain-containing protein [Hungatella hominis]
MLENYFSSSATKWGVQMAEMNF